MDQIKGKCGVKNESLMKYHGNVVSVAKGFTQVIFERIPREDNREANRLSQLATTYYDELPQGVYVEIHETPEYEERVKRLVLKEPKNWRTPIVRFLTAGQLHESFTKSKKIWSMSYKFHMY
ncbi:hypothetical protein LIER_10076 [Lithospermum erythrorhizon]|uniref:RNase H type-1 domain-containing protein n=1 Tax=Lithospermum erythrorhizon TaxID=34254 RepID=A0AAV3PKB4_LITER